MRKIRKGEVDKLIHPLHEQAFKKIDCLSCANCCKTTSPLFNNKDIDRIGKHLQMKSADFIDTYLYIDDDHEYVLKQTPCPFLEANNTCGIYDIRPKACQGYPHTDRVNQLGIMQLSMVNATICPAVADIFLELEKK